jgi:hypothetical protein
MTATLPPAQAAPSPASAAIAAAPKHAAAPRLERTSGSEVALVTSGAPLWRAQTVALSARSTTVRFVPLPQPPALSRVRLLNAARVDRLASRTRSWLAARGWRRITVGNASAMHARSKILYPAGERALAQRLSSQLGFSMTERPSAVHVTVVLGKDAAGLPRS